MCLYSIQASGCRDSLGMASGAIPDERISASSQRNHKCAASLGRLHLVPSGSKQGSWVAGTSDVNQWLQVDLGSIYTRVTGVATQGRNGYPQRVTKYKLQYGNDGASFQYYRHRGRHTDKVEWFNLTSNSFKHLWAVLCTLTDQFYRSNKWRFVSFNFEKTMRWLQTWWILTYRSQFDYKTGFSGLVFELKAIKAKVHGVSNLR